MCGILGYLGSKPVDCLRLESAISSLRHRGPNGQGLYQKVEGDRTLALAHTRLSIIDLDSRSNQPFHVDGGVLVFNGEIYNYLEIRRALEAKGERFHTDGDTEVLAHALRCWGEAALDLLEGMWAFAWYDERARSLLLSRDRFGEKPLYLWRRDGGLYFASEVKALAAMAGTWPQVNENHLLRYLVNGYKALYKVQETFFEEVSEFPAGTVLYLSLDGSERLSRYWSPVVREDEAMSFESAVEATREALVESVRLRLRADVPLAFCMSGGVDSNSLIAVARRVLNKEVHGFTIVNTDARYEEQELVAASVAKLVIRHTAIPLETEGFIDNLQSLVAQHDAPIYTISYYVHWRLMQAVAAEGYKVVISGTAADELFTGYYDHHNLFLYEIARDPALHEFALAAWREHQAPLVRNPHLKNPDLYLQNPTFRNHIYLNNDVFTGWMSREWAEPFIETRYIPGLLRNRMLNELFTESVPVILHEDDLNAMSCSLENRSPFLDRRLFEIAYSIPTRHLIRDGRAKAVLREAMRGIAPDVVLNNRKKVGFNAPIMDLLNPADPNVRTYLLDDSPIFQLVRKDQIEALLKEKTLANSTSKFLFNFVCAKMFLEEFGGAN